MESAQQPLQHQLNATQGRTLQVDFTWKNFKARISEKDDPAAKPLYILDFRTIRSPHLLFKSAEDDSVIGSGTLHAVNIDADCVVRGQPIKVKAMKRFITEYSHYSYAYSNTDVPELMHWGSDSNFKTWDFICVDSQKQPVAKFAANVWALKKVGFVEFMGPKANDKAFQEEIMVTGISLFYCMVLRASSILSLFGAFIAKPGIREKDIPQSVSRSSLGQNAQSIDAKVPVESAKVPTAAVAGK